MRKIGARDMCLMVVFSFLIFSMGFDCQAAEKPITFKFSHQFPPKHHLALAANLFAKVVAEKSHGSIKVQLFPAGQIYKETEIVDAVGSQSVEMGNSLMERWGGYDERFDVFGSNKYLILGSDSAWKVVDGRAGEYLSTLMAEKKGCRPIFWSCSGIYKGITNSRRPLIRPEDWKGLLLRVASAPTGQMVTLFGGSPVLMNSSEAYDAMQRKTVDGSIAALSSFYERKWYEVQKYLTVFMDSPAYQVWIVNLKWWNGLPGEKRDIIRQAALTAQAWDRKELDKIEAEDIKKLQKLITTHIQNEAEMEEWRNACKPIGDGWLKTTGAEGNKLLGLVLESTK